MQEKSKEVEEITETIINSFSNPTQIRLLTKMYNPVEDEIIIPVISNDKRITITIKTIN